jgi:hypothetical protein
VRPFWIKYDCAFCKGKHWFHSTMQMCFARWSVGVMPASQPKHREGS